MELHKWAVGFLIFTAIILTGLLVIGDLNSNYEDLGVNISTEKLEDANVTGVSDAIYELTLDTKGGVFGADVDETDTVDSMFTGSYKAIRFLRDTFKLFGNLIQNLAITLNIPGFFITLTVMGASLLIIFSIIYLVFRFQPR